MADDLMFQKLSTVQNDKLPYPTTIASAATVVPVSRFTTITGTVQLATITPPVTGYHELVMMFTHATPGALLTSGNIGVAYTPIQNRPFVLFYEPNLAKYYPMSVT